MYACASQHVYIYGQPHAPAAGIARAYVHVQEEDQRRAAAALDEEIAERKRQERPLHTVAASLTYGCSLCDLLLQPLCPTVAASVTHGCSLRAPRLQPR